MAGPRDDNRFTARLVLVAALGFVLFVPPVIGAFDHGGQVFGVPVIWAYLFVAWAAVIGLVFVLVRRAD